MKYVKILVLSLVLVMPGLAYGKALNPFAHSSDNPGIAPQNNSTTNSVPEPGTALTLAVGLLGLAAWRRYRQP
jgi:hypothetical protein